MIYFQPTDDPAKRSFSELGAPRDATSEKLHRVNTSSAVAASSLTATTPLSRPEIMLVAAATAGYMFDAFDTYLVSFAMPAIAREWKLTMAFTGMLASAGMWGMFLGAMIWGPISDRWGRKFGFAGTILGFSVLSGMTALSRNSTEFLVFRFLSGLFLGGMLPIASVLVAEQVPAARRGRLLAIPAMFWPVGLFLAAITSFLMIPHFGWHSVFFVGMLPVLLAVFIFMKVPESPRWIVAHRKRVENGSAAATDAIRSSVRESSKVPLAGLLRPPYSKRLALTASVLFFGFFGYYGFALWLPSILALKFKMGLAQAFSYTILVGVFAIFGKLSAFLTIDRFGRKQLFYIGFGMAALVSLLFGVLSHPLALLAGACALSFFLEEAAAGCVILPAEIFPSEVRGTANSWSSAAGKLAAALSPLVFGFAMARQWYYAVFCTMAVFFGIACAVIYALDVEPKGKALGEMGAS